MRTRNFTFTLNNYLAAEVITLKELDYKYLVFGREVGESGTPHLQGYIVFRSAKTLSAAIKTLPSRCHVEVAKGNSLQNFKYCTKDGDFEEFGERPKTRGEKGDLEKERWVDAFNAAKEGRFDDIPCDIRMRHYRTIKLIRRDHQPQLESLDDVCGIWIYGPPGTGKSHWARENYPNAYIKAQNKWFDGYDPDVHDAVILDDLDNGCLGHYLKIWTDKYPFNAETKGGTVFIRPTKVIVTSNFKIEELHEKEQIVSALKRRFEVKEFLIKYRQ
jgi:hypothetical protein